MHKCGFLSGALKSERIVPDKTSCICFFMLGICAASGKVCKDLWILFGNVDSVILEHESFLLKTGHNYVNEFYKQFYSMTKNFLIESLDY